MRQTWISLLLALSLTALLAGCGGDAAGGSTPPVDSSAPEDGAAAEELTEYTADGIAAFFLPEGFTLESGAAESNGMPITYATLTRDQITVDATRYGADAYEAAGVPLPADLEEYSQRAGVKGGLPEGTEFSQDTYGNLYAEYADPDQEGFCVYYVLKQGTDAFGAVTITCPEEEFGTIDAALWASKAELK